ncbi:MAG: Crp/Fnr family transcriptional regulator [Clostridia bacterium]|nr:Crp/Fnr family transcriptional regulator [Clostridia bacterium]
MDTIDLSPALLSASLFEGLEKKAVAGFLKEARCRLGSFPRGTILLSQGDSVAAAGVLLSGKIKAYRLNRQGEENLQSVLGPGSMFGDMLMATDNGKSPVTVEVTEDARVLFVPFDSIMAAGGEFGNRLRVNLLHELSARYWALSRKVRYLSERSLRGRIALFLLDAARDQGGLTFTLPMTREAMASLLGVNRSALSRELSRMEKDGLVAVYRGSFRLLSREGLESCIG